jgi:hypothetical protein
LIPRHVGGKDHFAEIAPDPRMCLGQLLPTKGVSSELRSWRTLHTAAVVVTTGHVNKSDIWEWGVPECSQTGTSHWFIHWRAMYEYDCTVETTIHEGLGTQQTLVEGWEVNYNTLRLTYDPCCRSKTDAVLDPLTSSSISM